MNVITSCFDMKNKFIEGCISKKTKSRSTSPFKVNKTHLSPKSSENSHKTSKGAKHTDKHTNAPKNHAIHKSVKQNIVTKLMDTNKFGYPKKT